MIIDRKRQERIQTIISVFCRARPPLRLIADQRLPGLGVPTAEIYEWIRVHLIERFQWVDPARLFEAAIMLSYDTGTPTKETQDEPQETI